MALASDGPAGPIRKTFFCVDGHTCGRPVRLVAGGGPLLVGETMSETRQDFLSRYDQIRAALMFEPRGHGVMSGSVTHSRQHALGWASAIGLSCRTRA